MSKKSFLQGAVILGVAGIIIKVLGAFFRIPLANLIGDQGMGYYQTAYPIYVLFLVLSTSGIPIAISKLVSERVALGNEREAYRVFRVSFILLFGLGASSFLFVLLAAKPIVMMLKNPGAYYSMVAIAPALLFVPIMAAYRGYFQGHQNMKPTAISQIVEQSLRVAAGLGLAVLLMKYGTTFAAGGATFGAAAGAIAGSIAVITIFMMKRKEIKMRISESVEGAKEKVSEILFKIFIIAIPVTIGAAIMPIMSAIDVAIVMRRLQHAGFTEAAANSLYGQLTGMAAPLINFPGVLSMSIAMSLVPAIAGAKKRNDIEFMQYNVELGLRTAMLIGLPAAFGLMTLSKPIMLLLYPLQVESAISAAPNLFILAFGIIFLSTVQTLTGVLQGIGKQSIPVVNLLIGSMFKIAITYALTGIPAINVKGAAIGTVTAYIVASALNLMAIEKYTGTKLNMQLTFIKPLISSLCMSAGVFLTYTLIRIWFGNSLAVLTSMMVGVAIYAIMLFVTKSIKSEEIQKLPRGDKLIKLWGKIRGRNA
ncbi:MAG: polysaccharide biosynthesis protein [Eubacteriales bacterium]